MSARTSVDEYGSQSSTAPLAEHVERSIALCHTLLAASARAHLGLTAPEGRRLDRHRCPHHSASAGERFQAATRDVAWNRWPLRSDQPLLRRRWRTGTRGQRLSMLTTSTRPGRPAPTVGSSQGSFAPFLQRSLIRIGCHHAICYGFITFSDVRHY